MEPGMSLKDILAAKGGNVIGIEPTADLVAAAKLLSTHRIGALLVRDPDGRLVGILSERDIVRTMADVGSAVLQVPVAQVMTRNVSTCDVNDSISSLMERRRSKIAHRHAVRTQTRKVSHAWRHLRDCPARWRLGL